MALINGTFQTPGAQRYHAASWVRVTSAPGARFAAFAGDLTTQDVDGKEGFESGWGEFSKGFLGFFQDLAYAFFDFAAGSPKNVEDFNDLWGAGPAVIAFRDGPYALAAGQTLLVAIEGRPPVTVTFRAQHFLDAASARPGEVAVALNEVLVDAFATVKDKHVEIVTHRTGPAIHLQLTGGTALAALGPLDPSDHNKNGTAEGATFFRQIEVDFAHFGPSNVATFDEGYGLRALTADPSDLSGRFTLEAPENFQTWTAPILTAIDFGLYGLLAGEHYYGYPSELYMQTYFPSV